MVLEGGPTAGVAIAEVCRISVVVLAEIKAAGPKQPHQPAPTLADKLSVHQQPRHGLPYLPTHIASCIVSVIQIHMQIHIPIHIPI